MATNVADFDLVIKNSTTKKDIDLDMRKFYIQNQGEMEENYKFFRFDNGFAIGCKAVDSLEEGELQCSLFTRQLKINYNSEISLEFKRLFKTEYDFNLFNFTESSSRYFKFKCVYNLIQRPKPVQSSSHKDSELEIEVHKTPICLLLIGSDSKLRAERISVNEMDPKNPKLKLKSFSSSEYATACILEDRRPRKVQKMKTLASENLENSQNLEYTPFTTPASVADYSIENNILFCTKYECTTLNGKYEVAAENTDDPENFCPYILYKAFIDEETVHNRL